MAGRKQRASSKSDSAEAIKPLIVLILLGTILYGGYSVIQKGRNDGENERAAAGGDAPLFDPAVEEAPSVTMPPAATTVPLAVDPPPSPAAAAAVAPAAPMTPTTPPPFTPPPFSGSEPLVSPGPTYVAGREGPPPTAVPEDLAVSDPAGQLSRGDAGADLAEVPPPASFPDVEANGMLGSTTGAAAQRAAFTADWDEAHDQLAAGRYAEALALLSTWYNDADLAFEENQRLEDLLGQLAGTVIYSQKDLLMPPHVVGAGETLPAIAAPLGVNWQLLAKINGIPQPDGLIPGESLKVLRGPFDADVSLSRRRLTLRLTGNYAGSFPMAVGEAVAARDGESLAVVAIQRGGLSAAGPVQQASFEIPDPSQSADPAIRLEGDLMIVASEDPAEMAHEPPATHLIVSRAHLADLLDILTPSSRVTIGR